MIKNSIIPDKNGKIIEYLELLLSKMSLEHQLDKIYKIKSLF
jgi:hypothetical protein